MQPSETPFTSAHPKMKMITLLIISLAFIGCNPPLSKRNLLIIGDDHAAGNAGWVFHFQQLRKSGPYVNTAVIGATTAFPSPSEPTLNTLDQLIPYLRKGFAEMGAIDEVIIQLGTNDCQTQYQSSDVERSVKFRELIDQVQAFFGERGQPEPRIVLISPPLMANEVANEAFKNANPCLKAIATDLALLAQKRGFCYLDLSTNQQLPNYLNEDGVSYQAEGLKLMTTLLKSACY